MARAVAEISIDTRLVMERLDKAEIGQTVSYDELSAIIGRSVLDSYHLTRTARNRLLRESKKHFEAVPGVGFKRCSDSEKVASGGAYLARSRRACRRGARITTSVDDYDAMTNDDKVRHNAQLSLLLTMRAISTPAKMKSLESKVQTSQQSLSMKGTLEAIAASKPAAKQKRTTNGASGPRLPVAIN